MLFKHIKNKRILIIDDFQPFRRSLRVMLENMGAEQIDATFNANEAIKKCRRVQFDIILCDYNLGEKMDGQELHDELVHRGLVTPKTLFLMVTAEDSAPMVISSVICEPDAYITKPFGLPELRSRFKRLFSVKEALHNIHTAMEHGEDDQAIVLCDHVRAQNPRYTQYCLKLKSYLLMKNLRMNEARSLFESVNKELPLPWALLGQCKIHIYEENHAEAVALLEKTIELFPYFLPAYDLLSHSIHKLDNTEEAQNILETAVRISPKNVNRQVELAQLADLNNDKVTKLKAYRNAVKYGQHTRHKDSDNYVQLANSITEALSGSSSMKEKLMLNEAHETLKKVKQDFAHEDETLVRAGLSLAGLFDKSGKPDDAKSERKIALLKSEEIEEFSRPETLVEVAEGFIKEGDQQRASELLRDLQQRFPNETHLLLKHEELLKKPEVKEIRKLASEHNVEGVAFYKQKKLTKAANMFMLASDTEPSDPSYSLNAVQVLTEIASKDSASRYYKRALRYLERIELEEGDYRLKRYHKLKLIVSQLGKS